jgi:hypothetical protein
MLRKHGRRRPTRPEPATTHGCAGVLLCATQKRLSYATWVPHLLRSDLPSIVLSHARPPLAVSDSSPLPTPSSTGPTHQHSTIVQLPRRAAALADGTARVPLAGASISLALIVFGVSATPSSPTTHRRGHWCAAWVPGFQRLLVYPHAPATIAPPAPPLPGFSGNLHHRVGSDRIQEPVRCRAHSFWRLAGPGRPLHGEVVIRAAHRRDGCAEPCARRTRCAGPISTL